MVNAREPLLYIRGNYYCSFTYYLLMRLRKTESTITSTTANNQNASGKQICTLTARTTVCSLFIGNSAEESQGLQYEICNFSAVTADDTKPSPRPTVKPYYVNLTYKEN